MEKRAAWRGRKKTSQGEAVKLLTMLTAPKEKARDGLLPPGKMRKNSVVSK